MGTILSKIADGVRARVDATRNYITTTRDNIKNGICERVNNTHEAIQNKIDNTRNAINTKVSNTRDGIVNAVTSTRDGIVNRVTATRDSIVNTVTSTRDRIVNTVTRTRDGVVTKVTNTRNGIVNTVTRTKDGIVNKVTNTRDGIVNTVTNTKNGIYNRCHSTKCYVVGTVTGTRDSICNRARNTKNAIKRVTCNTCYGVCNCIKHSKKAIHKSIDYKMLSAYNKTRNTKRMILNGAFNVKTSVKHFVKRKVTDVKTSVKGVAKRLMNLSKIQKFFLIISLISLIVISIPTVLIGLDVYNERYEDAHAKAQFIRHTLSEVKSHTIEGSKFAAKWGYIGLQYTAYGTVEAGKGMLYGTGIFIDGAYNFTTIAANKTSIAYKIAGEYSYRGLQKAKIGLKLASENLDEFYEFATENYAEFDVWASEKLKIFANESSIAIGLAADKLAVWSKTVIEVTKYGATEGFDAVSKGSVVTYEAGEQCALFIYTWVAFIAETLFTYCCILGVNLQYYFAIAASYLQVTFEYIGHILNIVFPGLGYFLFYLGKGIYTVMNNYILKYSLQGISYLFLNLYEGTCYVCMGIKNGYYELTMWIAWFYNVAIYILIQLWSTLCYLTNLAAHKTAEVAQNLSVYFLHQAHLGFNQFMDFIFRTISLLLHIVGVILRFLIVFLTQLYKLCSTIIGVFLRIIYEIISVTLAVYYKYSSYRESIFFSVLSLFGVYCVGLHSDYYRNLKDIDDIDAGCDDPDAEFDYSSESDDEFALDVDSDIETDPDTDSKSEMNIVGKMILNKMAIGNLSDSEDEFALDPESDSENGGKKSTEENEFSLDKNALEEEVEDIGLSNQAENVKSSGDHI
ncbi:unnamed protein product [Owenia fusiformis]|uniref:Uncharacterized protein n=1 Tax=Owenia fusiformis TaxID=6347 RepID=A0A8J1TKL6_OWEFU|nr:unnamed protein product [Owenia fusiformis]